MKYSDRVCRFAIIFPNDPALIEYLDIAEEEGIDQEKLFDQELPDGRSLLQQRYEEAM